MFPFHLSFLKFTYINLFIILHCYSLLSVYFMVTFFISDIDNLCLISLFSDHSGWTFMNFVLKYISYRQHKLSLALFNQYDNI